METQEARTGTVVRVREGYRKHDLVGMHGTVRRCWGNPDYLAVDVDLEDGRSQLLWAHQLDVLRETDEPSSVRRFQRHWRR